MDRHLRQEIKNYYQNENQQGQFGSVAEEDEELQKKCYNQMDSWQKQSEEEFLKKCLKQLGLCERKGLDGQVMLYPQIKKERKLEKQEFNRMVDRLYKVKKTKDNDFVHLNEAAKKQILDQQEKTKKAAQLRQKPKQLMKESTYDDLFLSNSNLNTSNQNSSFL